MLAKDIMHRPVISVERYLTLAELAKIFSERCITGAPVVDEEGRILGVVSQTDLVRERREASSGVPLFHLEPETPTTALGIHFEDMDGKRVEEIMTPGAIAVEEGTSMGELAHVMLDRHIHRVLITRDGKLSGIVTTMDMLRALAPKTNGHAKKATGHAKRRAAAKRRR
jgi:predicted transcriptional regulator